MQNTRVMERKTHIEEYADMLTKHGVAGPSVTPSVPYEEAEAPREKEPPPTSTVPAEGTDAGG